MFRTRSWLPTVAPPVARLSWRLTVVLDVEAVFTRTGTVKVRLA